MPFASAPDITRLSREAILQRPPTHTTIRPLSSGAFPNIMCRFTRTGVLLFIGLAFLSPLAAAQYRIDSWTINNGLPQNGIHNLWQTRDGYLWLTTVAGLVRFDGVRFTVFDRSNTKPSPATASIAFMKMTRERCGRGRATADCCVIARASSRC